MQLIIVPCPDCNGEGGHSWPVDINRFDGSLIERTAMCEACQGGGSLEVEPETRTLDDLEQEDFDMLEAQASR